MARMPCCEYEGYLNHDLYGCGERPQPSLSTAAAYGVLGFFGLLAFSACVGAVIWWWPA
jgi:hypothetical protein